MEVGLQHRARHFAGGVRAVTAMFDDGGDRNRRVFIGRKTNKPAVRQSAAARLRRPGFCGDFDLTKVDHFSGSRRDRQTHRAPYRLILAALTGTWRITVRTL